MKNLNAWFWMVLIGALILPAASRAETVYVSEEFEITMRTGPGNDRKIISLIKSGNPMEILEKNQEWSMVRIPSGKEGWVLNRYITTGQPIAKVLERVRKDYDVLAAKSKELKERFDRLDAQQKATDGVIFSTFRFSGGALAPVRCNRLGVPLLYRITLHNYGVRRSCSPNFLA